MHFETELGSCRAHGVLMFLMGSNVFDVFDFIMIFVRFYSVEIDLILLFYQNLFND